MNVVDSSAWLEYFAGTSLAKPFVRIIEEPLKLLIPSIVIYEVFKKILLERGEDVALQIIAHMKTAQVVDLDLELSLWAAKRGKDLRIPMADSIILATAEKYQATIWTLDQDFKGLPGVKYFKK